MTQNGKRLRSLMKKHLVLDKMMNSRSTLNLVLEQLCMTALIHVSITKNMACQLESLATTISLIHHTQSTKVAIGCSTHQVLSQQLLVMMKVSNSESPLMIQLVLNQWTLSQLRKHPCMLKLNYSSLEDNSKSSHKTPLLLSSGLMELIIHQV